MKVIKVALLFCMVAVFSGCAATFPGKDYSNVDFNKLQVPNPKPNMCLSTSVYNSDGSLNLIASALYKEKVERIFAASNLFSNVVSGSTRDGMQVKLNYNVDESRVLKSLAGLVSSLTLGVIPVHTTTEFKLSAEVWNNGKLVKTYEYDNTAGTWVSIFAIPFGEKRAGKVGERIVDDMSMQLLNDMSHDNLLIASSK